jgi:hypothetical protein
MLMQMPGAPIPLVFARTDNDGRRSLAMVAKAFVYPLRIAREP